MYRHYARGIRETWSQGVQCARDFIGGDLYRHVTSCTRHGRLGVPAELDGRSLCEQLPGFVENHGEFGLLMDDSSPRLLVVPVRQCRDAVALCFGAWPGIERWDGLVEPRLPFGLTLLRTRWNGMPDLVDAFGPVGLATKRM